MNTLGWSGRDGDGAERSESGEGRDWLGAKFGGDDLLVRCFFFERGRVCAPSRGRLSLHWERHVVLRVSLSHQVSRHVERYCVLPTRRSNLTDLLHCYRFTRKNLD